MVTVTLYIQNYKKIAFLPGPLSTTLDYLPYVSSHAKRVRSAPLDSLGRFNFCNSFLETSTVCPPTPFPRISPM